jgi:hypothetical protein
MLFWSMAASGSKAQTYSKKTNDTLSITTRPPSEREAVKELLETNITHLGRVILEINNKTMDRNIGIEGFKMIEVQQILHTYGRWRRVPVSGGRKQYTLWCWHRRGVVEAIRDLDAIDKSLNSLAAGATPVHSFPHTLREPARWQIRLDRDVETLRAPEISWHKVKRILHSPEAYKRYGIALTAGVAVLAPMMIMVLAIPSQRNLEQWRNIVVVSVSVLFLATFISWTSNSTHQELMVAVASYAAVLLIFVGTQTQSQRDGQG